ncbi:hypothetical protein [Egbenema bharatensis]|uniref:hypothetical protein n=1 Tax=Egbenema bharatensis TaxID=3463334 RepID=UPI003A89AA77
MKLMILSRRFGLIVASSFLVSISGCESITALNQATVSQSAPAVSEDQSSSTEPFRNAVNKAMEVAELTQRAKTPEEWREVANLWEQAITLMKSVPQNSPSYETAQSKVSEYQRNLEYAQNNSGLTIETPQANLPYSQPQPSDNIPRRPGQRVVRLVPYSAAISHSRSKPREEIEAANRERFRQAFQVNEIYLTYTCTLNHRALLSSTSLDAVNPQRLYSLINEEFENATGSNLSTDLCRDKKSTTFRSVNVSVSIIEQ